MSYHKNKHLLLVEDQLIIGLHQKMELEKKEYQVTHVPTGEDAIETVFDTNSSVDLVLMDIDLGSGLDGIETAQQILEKKEIPIVFLSSHTEPEVVEKTEQVTSYGYVVKNSGITVLDASIKMAFKLHEAKLNEHMARLQVEKLLELSESSMDQLLDNMLEGFLLVDPVLNNKGKVIDLRYLKVNKAVEAITRIRAKDYIGRTANEIFNNEVEESYYERHTEVLKTGEPKVFTEKFEHLNQWYELSTYKVESNKLAIFFHDITDRILTMEALRESENKYRNLFDYMADEVHFWKIIKGEKGEIKTWQLVDANPKALESWNKTREEVLGKKTEEIFGSTEPIELFMPIVKKIFETQTPYSWDTYYESTKQHLHMTSVPFGEYFVTTGIDVTHNELLKKEVEEKEILVKEILHRVKNSFSSMISILKLQSENISNPEALDVINESTSRLESMSIMYDKLLVSEEYKGLEIGIYLRDLTNSIIELMAVNSRIDLNMNIDDFILEEKKIFPVGAIINELMTNSIKHAFNGKNKGNIKISLTKNDNDINLIYEDNGVGLPEGLTTTNGGLGLMLINIFTQQLNCKYKLSNNPGARFELSFRE